MCTLLLTVLLPAWAAADDDNDSSNKGDTSEEGGRKDKADRKDKREEGVSRVGPRVSRRAQPRYEDVLTTENGTRWRGNITERGDSWRIVLPSRSEVVIPKDEIVAITRELHPGYVHSGQWGFRWTLGFEGGARVGSAKSGARYGAANRFTLSRSFGGLAVPELQVAFSPFGFDEGDYSTQIAGGARIYYREDQRGKPFTDTHIVFAGSLADLGFRTTTGFQYDTSPNFGLSGGLGVLVLTQKSETTSSSEETEDGERDKSRGGDETVVETALGAGLTVSIEAQVRF